MTIASVPNLDLAVADDNKPRWNPPDFRRHGFHNCHRIVRWSLSSRAPSFLPLVKDVDWRIGERLEVARFLAMPHFSAFIVVRGDRSLYDAFAPNFGPKTQHPMMSATKTTLNLMLGRCVSEGVSDLDRRVRDYLPEIGTGYSDATVATLPT
ncbi:beta-lactamase family protein [Mesorhizobium sp. M0761]|uniref:serine hydrolase n=1 Tax=Mesorhizobium sp. M0761 TaxID=2956994 RepID=UPI00333CE261